MPTSEEIEEKAACLLDLGHLKKELKYPLLDRYSSTGTILLYTAQGFFIEQSLYKMCECSSCLLVLLGSQLADAQQAGVGTGGVRATKQHRLPGK